LRIRFKTLNSVQGKENESFNAWAELKWGFKG